MSDLNSKIKNALPADAKRAIELIWKSGYEAYAVGGCVRDILRGNKPSDIDITTSAPTEKTAEIFAGCKIIETGVRFGTLTVVFEGRSLEITTMRCDGDYTDGRRPDFVIETDDIELDLARRDFTINAMAYSTQTGLIDPFSGVEDLEKSVVRAVGKPETRFTEDGLRMLRAMRFAATLSFQIERRTANAILRLYPRLATVSQERILGELLKLVCGVRASEVMREFEDVLFFIMPELKPMCMFEQKSLYHIYDVWEHTLHVIGFAPRDRIVRMAALFHDVGKPHCMKIDSFGHGHFKTHAIIGAEITAEILERLRFPKQDARDIWELVRYHDDDIAESDYEVRRWLGFLGEGQLRKFLDLQEADSRAKSERSDTQFAKNLRKRLDNILRNGDACTLEQLAINGHDLMVIGDRGARVGEGLQALLEHVLHEPQDNTRDKLIALARKMQP